MLLSIETPTIRGTVGGFDFTDIPCVRNLINPYPLLTPDIDWLGCSQVAA